MNNPFTSVGPDLTIVQRGVPTGLAKKRISPGYILENGTVLLDSEQDAYGNYIGGAGMDGMYLKTDQIFMPVIDQSGEIRSFRLAKQQSRQDLSSMQQNQGEEPVQDPSDLSFEQEEKENPVFCGGISFQTNEGKTYRTDYFFSQVLYEKKIEEAKKGKHLFSTRIQNFESGELKLPQGLSGVSVSENPLIKGNICVIYAGQKAEDAIEVHGETYGVDFRRMDFREVAQFVGSHAADFGLVKSVPQEFKQARSGEGAVAEEQPERVHQEKDLAFRVRKVNGEMADIRTEQEDTEAMRAGSRRKGSSRISKTPAKNFTQEQMNSARDVDLLNYLETHGYEVRKHGSSYKVLLHGHDSDIIFPETNRWYNFASGEGGNVLDWLVKKEGKTLVNAVQELIGETFDPQKLFQKGKKPEPEQKPFVLPEPADNNRRAFAYLLKTRGIDRQLVEQYVRRGLLYQGRVHIEKNGKSYDIENCVFANRDQEGQARGAMLRSMNDESGYSFKGNAVNTDRSYGFAVEGQPGSTWLTLCESPIEILSKQTLQKMHGESTDEEHFLSLNGVSDTNPKLMIQMIDHFLETHPEVTTITIALNNDQDARRSDGTPDLNHGTEAGRLIKEHYGESLTVIEQYPVLKDYNLELKQELVKQNQPLIAIPDKSPDNRRTLRYLTETKELDPLLVKEWIADRRLYQSEREIERNGKTMTVTDAVFVQRDSEGTPVYAIGVSHSSSEGKTDFRTEYRNDNTPGGCLWTEGKGQALLVFNNPISMLSYRTCLQEHGLEDNYNYICCIKDPSAAVQWFMENHTQISKIKVMMDESTATNQRTGERVDYRARSFERIKNRVGSRSVSVERKYAKGIDWNQDVKELRRSEQAQIAKNTPLQNQNVPEIER